MATDEHLVEEAAEETLRVLPVVNFVVRIAQQDFEYKGVAIDKGRRVILNFKSASRDPAHFSEPESFCPRSTGRHAESYDVPFGLGDHYCLGAGLARAEMQEALGVLTKRLTDVEVLRVGEMTNPVAMLYGPEELTITCRRR
jgi:cytochrome P450